MDVVGGKDNVIEGEGIVGGEATRGGRVKGSLVLAGLGGLVLNQKYMYFVSYVCGDARAPSGSKELFF